MNIKEIAKLSGVSVSTVSKIINKKDENISEETRDKVIKIVRENNYRPYSGINAAVRSNNYLLGLLLDGTLNNNELISSITASAKKHGYSVIVTSSESMDKEIQNINILSGYHVDGVIWQKSSFSSHGILAIAQNNKIPVEIIDNHQQGDGCLTVDYKKLAYDATKQLVMNKHKNILCLLDAWDLNRQSFVEGYEKCLSDNKINNKDNTICVLGDKEEIPEHYFFSATGVVCFNPNLAGKVYEYSLRRRKRIPKYISVVSISNGEKLFFLPELTVVNIPYKEMADFCVDRLVSVIEGKRPTSGDFMFVPKLKSKSSVDIPILLRNKKIVVVGSTNMDTLISMDDFPAVGETNMAQTRVTMPGGKGLNQAVGAAKLGADTYLISKVGKDYEGGEVYNYLQANEVNVDGVSTTSNVSTGQAYIHIRKDGESGIVIYKGANDSLSVNDINQNLHLFANASFCLLQTEIGLKEVEFAAKVANDYGVKILLKPSVVSRLSDELLSLVDIFMPNKREADILCPNTKTLEEKGDIFLKKGVKNVIITLGNKGCFWTNGKVSKYFPAAKFTVVDTTGAADAFAAALAVYLSKGFSMEAAIVYATVAAGFSTTRRGVPSSLIDASTLEFYVKEQQGFFTKDF